MPEYNSYALLWFSPFYVRVYTYSEDVSIAFMCFIFCLMCTLTGVKRHSTLSRYIPLAVLFASWYLNRVALYCSVLSELLNAKCNDTFIFHRYFRCDEARANKSFADIARDPNLTPDLC